MTTPGGAHFLCGSMLAGTADGIALDKAAAVDFPRATSSADSGKVRNCPSSLSRHPHACRG